jgi:outer membrane protein assembly factor BamB
LLWAQQAGTYVYTAPAVWNQTVYVGSYDGKVYAFDAGTGRLRWTYESTGSIHGAPTVMGGLVYFSVCGTCGTRTGVRYAKAGRKGTFALDARTGKLVWTFWDGRYSPIVADEKRVYMIGHARVYGLEPCPKLWSPDRKQPYRGLLKTC